MDLLTRFNRDDGITIVMVTHEPDMAAYAHRLIRFLDGRIEPTPRRNGSPECSAKPSDWPFSAIRRNALRSFLTVLGVVIGVAAVIAMVTLGQGTTEQVTEDVAKLGTNLLMVRPGQAQRGPQPPPERQRPST